jgi:hypothetical protein
MFQALLAHLQDSLHKRHLVYCVSVISVGFTGIEVEHVGFTILVYVYYDAQSTKP